MQTLKPFFTETEQLIGYVETDSGALLLTDGIWRASLPPSDQQLMVIDTELERTKFPVYTVMRGGQRFLLIALDTNVVPTRITADNDRVAIDEPLSEEELAEREQEPE